MEPSLSNSTLMAPLNTTESSLCTLCLSSLGCLTLVRSDRLPSCSLWRWRCSLAVALSSHSRRSRCPEAICLSHSVDSSALSYTVRSPSSHRTLKALARVQNWNARVPLFPFVQFKFSVYGLTQTDRHTHASSNAVPLVWDSLRLAPLNVHSVIPFKYSIKSCMPNMLGCKGDQMKWYNKFVHTNLILMHSSIYMNTALR